MAERVQVREITNDEGNRLLRMVRRSSGSVVTWRRAQMVLLSAQGMDVAAIARVTFTSPDRVRDVLHNFNADGFDSLRPKYASGRPPKFTAEQRAEVKKVALGRPVDHGLPFSTWSLSKLADYLVVQGVVDEIPQGGLDRPSPGASKRCEVGACSPPPRSCDAPGGRSYSEVLRPCPSISERKVGDPTARSPPRPWVEASPVPAWAGHPGVGAADSEERTMKMIMRPVAALGAGVLVAGTLMAAALPAAAQHGSDEGHLLDPITAQPDTDGDGDWGKIEFVSKLRVSDAEPGLIADVTAFGNYAYLARWGGEACAGPEGDGPDGGVYVIDISDPENPEEVGFIRTHQDTLIGEGMQVVSVDTAKFTGDVLVVNHEGCGKNYKAGVSLWDVTDPLKPKKLSEHFGDFTADDTANHPHVANQTHSAFLWQAGDRAYLVATDDEEAQDVDIFDVTNPKKPVLIGEFDLNEFDVAQPDLGLDESFLHDMVVKQIDGNWIMLLSYWDGGYILLDVDDPANPVFLSDTEFAAIDPELLEETGAALTPEGNGHQAEFTADNRFVIGTDEDFAPYRTGDFEITTGPNAGVYESSIVPGGAAPAILDDLTLNGPVVYGGYGCPDSEPVPTPESIPGYLESLQPGEETILVLQRGPDGDPSAPEEPCFPGEKAHEAALAGWDAVVLVNRHVDPDEAYCGSGAFVDEIVAVCTTHQAFHLMFNTAVSTTYPEPEPAIGDIGERISVGSVFDGWGYVHLFARSADNTLTELDTFAIPEAHDPDFAFGFGDLTVHEVATDPTDADLAYLSYYSAGLRAIQIQNGELVEVGGYIDPDGGNNFWGVEVWTHPETGEEYILASDRDSGLYIFTDP